MPDLTPYQAEALNYKDHISLTANAGSGKTFVLSRRYLEIALKEDIHLGNIIAITFTDKAAGELYKKISETLDEYLKKFEGTAEYKKLLRIRSQLVSANISTIHSFCINVLREFSPDAGLDANFAPIDSAGANELAELAVQEVISKKIFDDSDNEIVKYLIRVLGSKQNLFNELISLIHSRKKIQNLERRIYNSTPQESAKIFEETFNQKFQEFFLPQIRAVARSLSRILLTSLDEFPDNPALMQIHSKIEILSNSNAYSEIIKFLIELKKEIYTKTGGIKSRGFLSKDSRAILFDEIAEVESLFDEIDGLLSLNSNDNRFKELAKFGYKVISLYREIIDYYTKLKTERSVLDFEDILLLTKNLLSDQNVKEALQEKYKYIMIDEYQDTNEIQYDIFMPILNFLDSGNLFVVGDEKQSIYRFREADLKIFDKTKSEIKSHSQTENPKKLPHSFRLSPDIAFFTNQLFNKLFENPNPSFNEVGYDELVCANDQEAQGNIELLISDENSTQTEEGLVVAKISNLIADQTNDIKFNDIAILCRRREVFERLEEAFTESNIPYRIIGGKGFFQRQVIYDIYQYLSFLLNPSDDISLLGLLRSPFYSLSDTELYRLSLNQENTFFEKLQAMSANNQNLKQVKSLLEYHLKLSSTLPINLLLRRILTDSGFYKYISSKKNKQQELANINKLINLAIDFEDMSFKTLYDFVVYLQKAIAETSDESQAPVDDNNDAVNILTIHQSKGLEFKAVFLFEANKEIKKRNVTKGNIVVDDLGILAKLPSGDNYFDEFADASINKIYNYAEHKKDIAESKRLLYVAVTRAINYLAICGTLKNNKVQKKSFLDMVGSVVDIGNEFPAEAKLAGNLKFIGSGFEEFVLQKNLSIKIQNFIELNEKSLSEIKEDKNTNKKLLIENINSNEKNEVLSASKLNVFSQCPLKYQLIYELGYQKLANFFSSSYNFDQEYDLDNSEIPADLRGRVIHKLLENDINNLSLKNDIQVLFEQEITDLNKIEDNIEKAVDEIHQIVINYLQSSSYKYISSFSQYHNEYEMYMKINDIYLYGIIDKLLIDDEKIIIVDYKTDKVDEKFFSEKIENYINQLKFYAYLVSKRFGISKEINLKLVFLRKPDQVFEKKINGQDLELFENFIFSAVNSMRTESFVKNENHCRHCQFYSGNTCIVKS